MEQVKLGSVALDGTKVKANASKRKAMSYDRMSKRLVEFRTEVEKLLKNAQPYDEADDKRYGNWGLSGKPFGAPDQEMGVWSFPTEDLGNLFEEMGVNTGVDRERLIECVELAEEIAVRSPPGHIRRTGPNAGLSDIPE